MIAKFSIATFVLILVDLLICGQVACAEPVDCYAIFDAGSGGTRLHLYEDRAGRWIKHEGDTLVALAKPVVEDKEWQGGLGATLVGQSIGDAMKKMMTKGPAVREGSEGKGSWKGFKETCKLRAIDIYATAGMRLAEQKNFERSRQLWSAVIKPLRQMLDSDVPIRARTLTGFEEGLYAWMALYDTKKNDDFGIVEMGGASAQIAFPCAQCADALPVTIGGTTHKIFSYSFLGAGYKQMSVLYDKTRQPDQASACALGIMKTNPDWTPRDCSRTFSFTTATGIKDFYNYGPDRKQGRVVAIPTTVADIAQWYATGAFKFLKKDGIEIACNRGEGGYYKDKQCLMQVYFQEFIRKLGVRKYHPSDSDWTLGAVICDRDRCLPENLRPQCLWLEDGCPKVTN